MFLEIGVIDLVTLVNNIQLINRLNTYYYRTSCIYTISVTFNIKNYIHHMATL